MQAIAIDLSQVHSGERARAWQRRMPECFPGVEVVQASTRPTAGMIRWVSLGTGRIWTVVAPDQVLRSVPVPCAAQTTAAIILQHEGLSIFTQAGNQCRLNQGEFCVIDAGSPFEIETIGSSRVRVFQVPRLQLMGRSPLMLHRLAVGYSLDIAENLVLSNLLRDIADRGERIQSGAAAALQLAILDLLISLPPPSEAEVSVINWRVALALSVIKARLENPGLMASEIAAAQSISRRRLDGLFAKYLQSTISGQIAEHRLAQAATILCDPGQVQRQITAIAFAAGFSDSAHFTRAFRRRFGCTPSDWRKGARTNSTELPVYKN